MNLEFRKQEETEVSQKVIVESLKTAGLNNLASVNFINFRLLHDTEQDGTNAANTLLGLEKRPEIILLELVNATDDILNDVQRFIHGEQVRFPSIRNEFVKGLASTLRDECTKNSSYRPLIVCSEIREGKGPDKVRRALKLKNGMHVILFDRHRSSSYEYLLNSYKDTITKLVEAQNERDNAVASTFIERLLVHKDFASLKDATSITIAAPYGAQHGRLSALFKQMGAQIYSGATALFNRPSDKCEFLLRYGQSVPDSIFEESMLGYIVEQVLALEEEYTALRESQRNAMAWNVLRLILERYGSYEAAVMDFRKQMKSKGQSNSFSQSVRVAMSHPTGEKYTRAE